MYQQIQDLQAADPITFRSSAGAFHANEGEPSPEGLQSYGLGNATWVGTPRIISWQPMATVYDDFLSEEECDYLLNLAQPQMEPAMLVNSDLQIHKKSKTRTSHGAFFDSFEDPVLAMITHRNWSCSTHPARCTAASALAYCNSDAFVSH